MQLLFVCQATVSKLDYSAEDDLPDLRRMSDALQNLKLLLQSKTRCFPKLCSQSRALHSSCHILLFLNLCLKPNFRVRCANIVVHLWLCP